jgi:MinD superfamily P-loop ATPase
VDRNVWTAFQQNSRRGEYIKQLTVISGKGGTGKTTITAAFASIAENAVFADCDVDAADLHLILKPDIKKTNSFHGLKIASINKDKCTKCNKCFESCEFNAISKDIEIIKESCEGCKVCEFVCPEDAINMIDRDSGFFYISETRFGPMTHAMLKAAEEASGKLVSVVRENAKKLALEKNKNLIIIDGPPGIGCPVISSITGVDLVLIVTEPTLSAIHDLERILDVSNHFKISAVVCINKFDINFDNAKTIEEYCNNKRIKIVGKLPYDNIITESMIHEKTVVEFSKKEITNKIINMWKKTMECMK